MHNEKLLANKHSKQSPRTWCISGFRMRRPCRFYNQLHILHSMRCNSIINGTQFYGSYNNVIQHQLPYVAGHTLSNCCIPLLAPKWRASRAQNMYKLVFYNIIIILIKLRAFVGFPVIVLIPLALSVHVNHHTEFHMKSYNESSLSHQNILYGHHLPNKLPCTHFNKYHHTASVVLTSCPHSNQVGSLKTRR
jgi:hypothetical protein